MGGYWRDFFVVIHPSHPSDSTSGSAHHYLVDPGDTPTTAGLSERGGRRGKRIRVNLKILIISQSQGIRVYLMQIDIYVFNADHGSL